MDSKSLFDRLNDVDAAERGILALFSIDLIRGDVSSCTSIGQMYECIMEFADKVSLLTGFGGVILGAFITILGEWWFRKAEAKAANKRKFISCLVEVARTVEDQHSVLKTMTSALPDEQPDLISGNIRAFASIHIPLSEIAVDSVLSAGDKKDPIFSDLSIYFKRFNSNIKTLEVLNKLHETVLADRVAKGQTTPTGDRDRAVVEITSSDTSAIMQLLKLENLYRDTIKNLIADYSEGRSLLVRINKISERKYKKLPWAKAPKVEMIEVFEPKPYLSRLPYFEMSHLPTAKV